MTPDLEQQIEEIERQLDELEERVEHMHQTLDGLERRNKLQLPCLSVLAVGLLISLVTILLIGVCAG